MYRARNRRSMRKDAPRDRYGHPTASYNAFRRWAQENVFGQVVDIVRGNSQVHEVVRLAVEKVFAIQHNERLESEF